MNPTFVMASLPHLPRFDGPVAAPFGRARLDSRLAALSTEEQAMVSDLRFRLAPWREPPAPPTRLPSAVLTLTERHRALLAWIARLRAHRRGRAPAPRRRPEWAPLLAEIGAALDSFDARALERARLRHLWAEAERLATGHAFDRTALLLLVARWDVAIAWSLADPDAAGVRLTTAAAGLLERMSSHG